MTTSTSSRGDLSLPPATTFCPLERELTDLYLHRKIAGVPLPGDTGRFIHVADVYSAEPEKLAEQFPKAPGTGEGGGVHKQPVWYFFSPVRYIGGRKTNARGEPGYKSRTIDGVVGKRWWHSEKGEKPVTGGSEYGGYGQHFTYKVKNPSSGKAERAGWIMWEYGISPDHGGGDLVLCKIHPSPRVAAPETAEPVSHVVVNPKKRKAPAGDHPQDSAPSARPRHTDLQSTDQAAPPSLFLQNIELDFRSTYQNDMVMPMGDLSVPPWPPVAQPEYDAAGLLQQTVTTDDVPRQYYHDDGQLYASLGQEQPLLVENQNYNDVSWVDVEDPEMYGAAGFADQAAPPSNFFDNVEQDFWSVHQHDGTMPVGDLAVPAAQQEDDDAGLLQTVSGDDDPHQNYNDVDGQMYASFREEQPEPDNTAADEAIYGFPCPAFSTEMIRRCNHDLMMPWQSPSSMSITFGLY